MDEKRWTKKDRDAERARAQAHGEWLRSLLERAEASLPRERRRPVGMSNGEWLHALAERAKAGLDERTI